MSKENIEKWQREALKLNEGYKQYAGNTLMGGLPDNILADLVSQIIADTERGERERMNNVLKGFEVYDDEADNCRRILSEFAYYLTPPPQETVDKK